MRFTRSLITCALGVVSCAPVMAQSLNTSQVTGTVQDPTGAAVPDAKVVMTNIDTGQVRTITTSNSGAYTLPDLPIGNYRLEVTAPGFTTYVLTGIKLEVGSNPTFDPKLQVGNVNEQVMVTTQPGAQVETQSNGIGQVVDDKQVVELPLNGRDPTQLIALAGATTTAPAGDLNSNKNFPTVTIAVAGGLPNGVSYSLDGGFHNDIFNNLNLPLPFPDALQEFKVETNSLPAQYGNHAAAAVNAVTKSGTNSFHGDAFWFVRNYMFNAANFFSYNPSTGAKPRDSLKRNQFGGVLGGPIIKDRLFFFGGFQGTIIRSNPTSNLVYLPTQAEVNGDFSNAVKCNNITANKLNANYFNYTAGTPTSVPTSATLKVPISPVAKAIIAEGIPIAPAGDECTLLPVPISANSTQQEIPARVDYTLNSKQTLFARYFYANYDLPANVIPGNLLTANTVVQKNKDQSLVLGHTMTLTDHMVNSFRATGNRTLGLRSVPPYFNASDVGINIYQLPSLGKYVGITITNGFTFGQNPGYFNTADFTFSDDLSYSRGRHQMAFGAAFQYGYQNTVNNRLSNGTFTFSGVSTNNSTLGYADFVAGQVGTFQQGNADLEDDKSKYFGAYAQDTFKATPHLTLNYGVRYEPYIPFKNREGRAEHFDMAAFTAGTKTNRYTNAPAGLTFPGDSGFPGTSYNFGKKDIFEPRIGVIFDPSKDGTMSIRAGYGIFYDAPQLFFDTRYSNSAPYGSTVSLTGPFDVTSPYSAVNYGGTGANPFPGLSQLSSTVPFPLAGVYVNQPLHLKPMYLQQWNLSVQKQAGSWLYAATYLGNKTTHLPTSYEADAAVYIPGTSTGATGSCGVLTPATGLPKAGVACSSTGNTNSRRVLALQNYSQGQYYSTIGQYDDGGSANYNGVLVSVQHRGKVVNMVGNYTFAHCLSEAETTELTGPSYVIPGNRAASYSNCDSDRRQVANLSLILTSPRLKNRFEDLLAGGWGLASIFTARSGGYYSPTIGSDVALSGEGTQYLAVTGNPYSSSKTRFGSAGLLNKASFSSPATGTYALTRPLSLLGPGSYELDMALTRNFHITERQQVQFRWEVFNVPNEAIFANPTSSNTASANFGTVTATANAGNDQRIMQFALKYIF